MTEENSKGRLDDDHPALKPDREIKMRYPKLKEDHPEVYEKLNDIYDTQTRYGIILTIKTFGPCNIKKLARILGKNEATIHHHIKALTDTPSLLEVDQDVTMNQKGIYYTLTNVTEEFFEIPDPDELEDVVEKLDQVMMAKNDDILYNFMINEIKQHPDRDTLIVQKERELSYFQTLEDIMLQNYNQAHQAILEGKKPKNPNYPFGGLFSGSMNMKIATPKHQFKIRHLMLNFVIEFNKLKEEIQAEMDEEDVDEEMRLDYHMHLLGGVIGEFEFQEAE